MALACDRLLRAKNPVAFPEAAGAGCRARLPPFLRLESRNGAALAAAGKSVHWSLGSAGKAGPRGVLCTRCAVASDTLNLASTFAEVKKAGKVAFIPYLVAGDPDLETTAKAMLLLDQRGADILELGVPYTDPLADGPVIQDASTRALEKGITLEAVLEMLRKVSPQLRAPVVLFAYYNPIIKRGVENFLKSIKDAGASGLLVPDLVLEDTDELRVLTVKHGLELVLLTTPTTSKARMEAIAHATQGFLYLVSLTGVTGARAAVSSRVQNLLKDIKEEVPTIPVAVGFGISKPEHATQVVEWGADGVIIGSSIVKLLGEAATPEEGLAAIGSFTDSIRAAV